MAESPKSPGSCCRELRIATWLRRHPGTFFVATKTGQRTYRGAREEIRRSLDRLGVDQMDSIQLHNLVDVIEWETAPGADGAVEAAVEAREEGLVRFIDVTGHGLSVPEMHRRSLERFAFDSVSCRTTMSRCKTPATPNVRNARRRLRGTQRRPSDDQESGLPSLGGPHSNGHDLVRATARTSGHRPGGALGAWSAPGVPPAHRRRRRLAPTPRRGRTLRTAGPPMNRWPTSPARREMAALFG